jgi:hypothetical protein
LIGFSLGVVSDHGSTTSGGNPTQKATDRPRTL